MFWFTLFYLMFYFLWTFSFIFFLLFTYFFYLMFYFLWTFSFIFFLLFTYFFYFYFFSFYFFYFFYYFLSLNWYIKRVLWRKIIDVFIFWFHLFYCPNNAITLECIVSYIIFGYIPNNIVNTNIGLITIHSLLFISLFSSGAKYFDTDPKVILLYRNKA